MGRCSIEDTFVDVQLAMLPEVIQSNDCSETGYPTGDGMTSIGVLC